MTQVAPTSSGTKQSSLRPASTLVSRALWWPRAFPEWTLCPEGRVLPKWLSRSGPHPTTSSKARRHRGETLPPHPLLPAAAHSTKTQDPGSGLCLPAPPPPTQTPGAPGSPNPLSRSPSAGAEPRTQAKSAAAAESAPETQDSRAMHTLRRRFREGLARGGATEARGGARLRGRARRGAGLGQRDESRD